MDQPKIDLRERTKNFALRVVRMFPTLPKTTEAQILGRQLLRSGTSIGANVEEASGGQSRRDFLAKMKIWRCAVRAVDARRAAGLRMCEMLRAARCCEDCGGRSEGGSGEKKGGFSTCKTKPK